MGGVSGLRGVIIEVFLVMGGVSGVMHVPLVCFLRVGGVSIVRPLGRTCFLKISVGGLVSGVSCLLKRVMGGVLVLHPPVGVVSRRFSELKVFLLMGWVSVLSIFEVGRLDGVLL